jgi:hypothetical protein
MPDSEITQFMPGDILFYAKQQGDLADTVISAWTGGYVHVAIAISAVQKVEALAPVVAITSINTRAIAASWSYTSHAEPLVAENLHNALVWLIGQKGNLYGWGDIADAFIDKFEHGLVTLNIGDHFDCSALATEFLIKAGGVRALQNITDPHGITPAKLAQLLGV